MCILLTGNLVAFASPHSTFSIQILPLPQCSDGGDNDGDGAIDYPGDTGCSDASDDSEAGVEPISTPTPVSSGGGGVLPVAPITSVSFSGKAYPFALVTLLKDANVIGTVVATPAGDFLVYLNNMAPGEYVFALFAQDASQNFSSPFSLHLTLLKGSLTNVSGIFLSPTLDVSPQEVKRGDSVMFSGQSPPGAKITLHIAGKRNVTMRTSANQRGFYTYSLNTQSLAQGEYVVQAQSEINGKESAMGRRITFLVGTKTVSRPPGSCLKADLNCDGRVNLIDFSILVYWWDRPLTQTATSRVDFSGDASVNLIDFSIMVYYWTG